MTDNGKKPWEAFKPTFLDREFLDSLKDISQVKAIGSREHLFREGEAVDYVYRIRSGLACLYTILPKGRRVIIGFPSLGDILGYEPNNTYSMSAMTLTPVEVFQITRENLKVLFERVPNTRKIALNSYFQKVEKLREHVIALSRKTPREKVATFLFLINRRLNPEGELPTALDIPLKREEIGDFLALSSETVSRAFSQLAREKIISLETAKHIEILKPEKLKQIAALEVSLWDPQNSII